MDAIYENIAEGLIEGNIEDVKKSIQKAVNEVVAAGEILDRGLLAGMEVIGQRFKVGDMFIPEVIHRAKIMHGAMEILEPFLGKGDGKNLGKILMATVKGDMHDIGKNLVCIMLKGSGFNVVDLGIDVDSQQWVNAIKENNPDISGMSTLLTTTMPQIGETIKALKEADILDQVKVMIGGAPVTEDFAKECGADAYGSNAAKAVEKTKELVGIA